MYQGKHRKQSSRHTRKVIAMSVAGSSMFAGTASAQTIDTSGIPSQVEQHSPEIAAVIPPTVDIPDSFSSISVPTVTDNAATENTAASLVDAVDSMPVDGIRSAIVGDAHAQVGKPYVWGATGPGSFDCSGLMSFIFGNSGVNLPRVASAQATTGTPVTESQLQPGDLVGYSGGGHIGVYIGDGQVIHAPQPGDVVQIASLHMMPIWAMSSPI